MGEILKFNRDNLKILKQKLIIQEKQITQKKKKEILEHYSFNASKVYTSNKKGNRSLDFTNKVQNNAFDIPTMYYTGSPTPAYLCIQLWVSGIK